MKLYRVVNGSQSMTGAGWLVVLSAGLATLLFWAAVGSWFLSN